jgi:hypothetical protein
VTGANNSFLAALPVIGSAKAGVASAALTKTSAKAEREGIMAKVRAGGPCAAM